MAVVAGTVWEDHEKDGRCCGSVFEENVACKEQGIILYAKDCTLSFIFSLQEMPIQRPESKRVTCRIKMKCNYENTRNY